ncbi:MAG: hypothetical protein FJ160_07125 [Gammaproteobacteria bacterium]|nr:hypothetical protein [Gammaproteobacteria bacterium]
MTTKYGGRPQKRAALPNSRIFLPSQDMATPTTAMIRNQQNAIWNTVVRHLVHDEMSNALPEVGDEQRKDRR